MVRLDADILEIFESKGTSCKSRINAALRMEVDRNLTALASALRLYFDVKQIFALPLDLQKFVNTMYV